MALNTYNKELIYGLYDDEDDLLKAVEAANGEKMDIFDVYSPFPVHGLDELLGLEESRLHIVGFMFGALGALIGFLGMTWAFVSDWPTIFGGKPYWAVPAFIPITFEMTVLFCAVGMTVVFYIINGLGPGVRHNYLDPRITDDKFCLAFDKSVVDSGQAENLFKSTKASEVNSKIF